MRFEWDREKETANVAKHGVDFSEAQSAFADPLLVLAADKGHSKSEPRLFCIGRSAHGGIDSRCANRSSVSLADLTVYPSASQHDVFTPGAFHLSRGHYSHHRRRLLAERQKNL